MDKVSAYIEKQIKGYQKRAEDAESQLAAMTKQRDALLEAAENIENDDDHMPRTAWDMLQAAIAKCKEARDV